RRSVFTYGLTTRLLGRYEVPKTAAQRAARAAPPPPGPGYDATTDESLLETGTPAALAREAVARARDAATTDGVSAPSDGATGTRGPIRELGRFSVFQSYDVLSKGGDFIDEVDPRTGKVIPRDATRVSDLGVYLRLAPTSFATFEGRADYDVNEGKTKGANLFLSLSDPRTFTDDYFLQSLRGRSRVTFGYRFVANSALEEANGGLLLRLTKRYYGAFEARYDNLSKKFLEVGGGIRVISDCECWVLDVGVTNHLNPNETTARVLVSLVGLGQVGREPFGRTFGAISGPARS